MITNLDGSVEYTSQDDIFTEVKLNGVSVLNLTVLSAKVYPGGNGWVLTRKCYGDADKILLDYYPSLSSDGTDADEHFYTDRVNVSNNFFYHGKIEVTL
jgi:hypothetical protein